MVRRFEDLIAWQKARALVVPVYEVTRKGPASKDFAYTFQIRKAVLSISSNIAEGFERSRRAEFHQYLSISKASCAEVRSQLYSGLDLGYISQTQFEHLHAQAEEVGRLVGGLRASLKRQQE